MGIQAIKGVEIVPKALDTIDVATGEAAKAINQRSDVTETRRNFESYIANLNFK